MPNINRIKYTGILTVAIMTIGSTATAQPEVTLEVAETHLGDGAFSTTLDIYAVNRFGDSGWGISAFALIMDGWGTIYAGPTYAPIDELELNLSIGAQLVDGQLEPRYAGSLWVGYEGFSTTAVVEWDHFGTAGVWYDVTAKYQTLDWLAPGIRARRFVGLGPTIWFTIPDTPVGIWVSWTPWDPEAGTTLDRALGAITATF